MLLEEREPGAGGEFTTTIVPLLFAFSQGELTPGRVGLARIRALKQQLGCFHTPLMNAYCFGDDWLTGANAMKRAFTNEMGADRNASRIQPTRCPGWGNQERS